MIKMIQIMKYIRANFSTKIFIFILPLILLSSCVNVYYPQETIPSTSSEGFIKAKYLTELVYITRDKNLMKNYRADYINKNINKSQYRDINKWAAGKNHILVIKTIDMFLNLEFEGA